MLADIDHRLNQFQFWNDLRKLEHDVTMIYNYIDMLSNKIVTFSAL